jgi:hypothetical protein
MYGPGAVRDPGATAGVVRTERWTRRTLQKRRPRVRVPTPSFCWDSLLFPIRAFSHALVRYVRLFFAFYGPATPPWTGRKIRAPKNCKYIINIYLWLRLSGFV